MPKSNQGADTADMAVLSTETASRLIDPYEKAYQGLLHTPDRMLYASGMDYDLYRDLLRDGKVFDGMQKRSLALVGYEWTVESADGDTVSDEIRNLITSVLKKVNFDQVCKDLLEAILTGMAVSEIVWTTRDGWIVPDRIIQRKPSRFVFQQTEISQPPQLKLLTSQDMVLGEPVPDRKFIVHRVNTQDDNPYGMGLGRQSYWPVYFKRKGIIAWNKLVERFGAPTAWGKYQASATPREKSTLMAALQALSTDGTITTPAGVEIELLESKLSGTITTHRDLLEYMDEWLDAVWLGKEPQSRGSGGAQAAAAKERNDIRLALTKGDADLLSGTLNSTLMKWLCELNGWPECHVYRQVKEEADLQLDSETDKNISSMGFQLSEEGVRAKYGEQWSRVESMPAPVPQPSLDAPNAPTSAHLPVNQPPPSAPPANFAEQAQRAATQDAIDVLVEQATQEWEPLMVPLLEPIQAMLQEAAARGETAAQVLERLPQIFQQMDIQPLHDGLTKSTFIAKVAGASGMDV